MLHALLSSSYLIILIILGNASFYVTFFSVLLTSLSLSYIHIYSPQYPVLNTFSLFYTYRVNQKCTFINMFSKIILNNMLRSNLCSHKQSLPLYTASLIWQGLNQLHTSNIQHKHLILLRFSNNISWYFMTIKERYRKIISNTKWFYHTFVYSYLYTECILVITHTNDGHRSDRNVLLKNNMGVHVFIKCNCWFNIQVLNIL
jgi:hypothetical protein